MRESNSYYCFLDFIRLFCALLIVVIHMGFGNSFSIIPCLTRQGVPFFFLASGFFLSKKLQNSSDIKRSTIQYVKPILIVYLFWNIVWFPSILKEYSFFYVESPLKLFVVLLRRFFLAGIAPYWFLLVLSEGAVFLALIVHYRKYSLGFFLCIAGIMLSILYSYQAVNNPSNLFYRIVYTVFSWDNNVIMSGFPMLFLGSQFYRYKAHLQKAPVWMILTLYVISVAVAFFVFQIDKNLFFIPFGIIQAVMLFFLCIIPVPFLQNLSQSVCRNARNLSSVLFLTHTVFLTILGKVLHVWNSALRFGITVLCAVVMYLLSKWLKNKVINTLLLLK